MIVVVVISNHRSKRGGKRSGKRGDESGGHRANDCKPHSGFSLLASVSRILSVGAFPSLPQIIPAMAAIDITIAEADRNLANVDLKTAFSLYFDAVNLIASHIRSNTKFAIPAENDPHASIPGPSGPLRLKNWVVKQPEDIDRLFGLADLW